MSLLYRSQGQVGGQETGKGIAINNMDRQNAPQKQLRLKGG